jgi:predicted transport protein
MDLTGDITGEFTGEFVPYKREHNRRSLEIFNEILKQWLNLALPDEEVNYLTDYPDTAEKLPEGKESRQAA